MLLRDVMCVTGLFLWRW